MVIDQGLRSSRIGSFDVLDLLNIIHHIKKAEVQYLDRVETSMVKPPSGVLVSIITAPYLQSPASTPICPPFNRVHCFYFRLQGPSLIF